MDRKSVLLTDGGSVTGKPVKHMQRIAAALSDLHI